MVVPWMPSLYQEGEGQCAWRRISQEQPCGPPGYGRRHERTDTQSKLGNLSAAVPVVIGRKRLFETKKISRREEPRGAHEAVVSRDPAGQHNPLASQGPLDESAQENGSRQAARMPFGATGGKGLG